MMIVKPKPKVGVMVRISPETRKKVQDIALLERSSNERVTEADIYRTAIEFFLNEYSTKRREELSR